MQQQPGIPPAAAMQQPMTQPPALGGRPINGMPRGPAYIPNGTMVNGVGSAAMQSSGMTPANFSIPPNAPQPNGVTGPPTLSNAQGGALPNQNMFANRPPMTGAQQRGPNGVPPFQSPTMSHSPQNPGGHASQQPQQTPQQQQQNQLSQSAMGQLGPQTPGLNPANRGMLPPQGGPPTGNPLMSSGQHQHPAGTPTQSFQQVGRPPSRTATPGQGGNMMHPSPSMINRQPPGSGGITSQEQVLLNEILLIPPQMLAQIKQELGFIGKDPSTFSLMDKVT